MARHRCMDRLLDPPQGFTPVPVTLLETRAPPSSPTTRMTPLSGGDAWLERDRDATARAGRERVAAIGSHGEGLVVDDALDEDLLDGECRGAAVAQCEGPCRQAAECTATEIDTARHERVRVFRRAGKLVDVQVRPAARHVHHVEWRRGRQHDHVPVATERGVGGISLALHTVGADRGEFEPACVTVEHERVGTRVGIAADQVRGRRDQRDVAAVGTDARRVRSAIALHAARVDAQALGRARDAIADEHVRHAVGVAHHDVGGLRREDHVATVATDEAASARAVGLATAVAQADALGDAGAAVAQEHVRHAVGVTGDEVRRRRREHDVARVRADGVEEARGIRLRPARPEVDALGRGCLAIAHEDVGDAVGVAADEVGGATREGDKACIPAHLRPLAADAVGRSATETHAHERGPGKDAGSGAPLAVVAIGDGLPVVAHGRRAGAAGDPVHVQRTAVPDEIAGRTLAWNEDVDVRVEHRIASVRAEVRGGPARRGQVVVVTAPDDLGVTGVGVRRQHRSRDAQ
jgi:hypothetical protein